MVHKGGFLYHLFFCLLICFTFGCYSILWGAARTLRALKASYDSNPVSTSTTTGIDTFPEAEAQFPTATVLGLVITSFVLTFIGTWNYRNHDVHKLTL